MKNKLSKISHIFLLFLFILPLSSINNIYAQAQESISTTKTEYLTNDDDVAPIILNNRNDNSEYKWEISSKDIIDKTKYHYRPTFQAKNIEDIQNRINLNNTECSPEYQEIPNINKNISINPILSSARINISSIVYCYRLKIINNNNVSYSNVIKTIQYRENKIYNITNNQRLLSNLSQSTNNSQIIIDQQPIYDRFDNKCHYDLLPLEIKAHLSDEDIPEGKGLTYQWQRAIYNYQINSNENYIDIQGATDKIHIPDISATSNLQMYLYRVKISNSNQYIYSDTALRYRCPQDKINEDSNREYIAKLPFLYLNIKTEWKGTENQLKMQLLNNYNTPEEMRNSIYNENLTFNITINNNNISIPLRDIVVEGIYYNSFNQYDDQFLIKIKNRETIWTENNNTKERSTPTLDAIYERVKENRVGRVGKYTAVKTTFYKCVVEEEWIKTGVPKDFTGWQIFKKYNLCDLSGLDYELLEGKGHGIYYRFLSDLRSEGLLYKESLTDEELENIKNRLYEIQDQTIWENNNKSLIGKTKNLFLKDPKEKYINTISTSTITQNYYYGGGEEGDIRLASGTVVEITNTEIIDTGKYNIKNIIILLSFIIFTSSLFYLHKKKKINVNIIKNRKVWMILFLVIAILAISYFSINKASASEIGTCLPSSGAIDGALPLPNEYIFKKYGLCDLSDIDYSILEVKGYISYRQFLFDLYSKGYIGSQKSTLTNEELKYIKNKLYEIQDQIIYEENKKSIIGKTKNIFLKDPKEKYINSTGTITLSKDYHPNGMEDNKIASGTQIEITNTEIIDTGKYNIKNIIILLSFIIFTSFLFYLHKKKKINVIKNKILLSIIFILLFIIIIYTLTPNATSQNSPVTDEGFSLYQEVSQALIQYTFLTTSAQEIPHIYDNPLAINNFDPNTFDTDKFMTVSTTTNNSTATINILSQNNIHLQAVSQTPTLTTTAWSGEEIGFVINKPSGSAFNYYELECYYNNNNNYLYDYTTLSSATNYISFSRLGFNINTTYNCRVRAQVPNNTISAWSSTSIVRTSSALAYPSITSTSMTSDSITFRINKRGDIDFDEYYIYCSYNNGNNYKDTTGWQHTLSYVDTSSVSYTLIGLSPNTTYNCVAKIRNIPTYTSSNDSNAIQVVTPSNIPSIVTGFYLPNKATGDNNVYLMWNLSSANENVTNYNIQYATNSSFTNITNINTNSGNTNTKIITGLTNNTQYAFRIRAQNNIGFSEWGNVIVYATPSFPEYTSSSPDYWNRTAINADNAYNNLTTTEKNNLSNIVVGVIDTGIDIFHPDFWDDIDNDCPAWAFTNNVRSMDNYVSSRDALANCDFTNSSIYKNEGESGDTNLRKSMLLNELSLRGDDCVYDQYNNRYMAETNGCDDDNNGYIDDTFGANFGGNNSGGNNYLRVEHIIGVDSDDEYGGHGTSISSIVSSKKNNNKGIIGIAPNAKIMTVRAISANSSKNPLAYREINDYIINKNIEIINNSWGAYEELSDINTINQGIISSKELNNINKKKIVHIVSSGNENQNLSTRQPITDTKIKLYPGFSFPNSFNESINVGASNNTSNNIKDFSNYGNRTDIVAPGDCMLTSYASNLYQNNIIRYGGCVQNNNNVAYQMVPGTSIAAPHITGVVALMKAVNPNLTREQVRQILHKSGTDIGSNSGSKPSYQGVNANCIYRVGFDDCSGYGLINAYTAVQLARAENNTPYFITPFIYSPRTGDTLSDINSASSSIIISIDDAPNIKSYKISIQKNATGTNYENIIPATNTQWIDVKTDNTIRNALSLSTTTIDLSTIQNGLESGLYTMRIQAMNWNGDTFEHYVSGVKIEKVNQCRASLSVRYNSVNTCNSTASTTSISVSIYHHSSTSIPIPGAQISLTNTDNNTLVSTTTTNNTGAYTFNNVPTGGNYNISVSYTSSSSVNGININDNVRNAQIIVGTYTPTDDAKISADTNQDGTIDINDNVRNAQIIVGTYILPIPFIFIPTDNTDHHATSTENSITKKNYLWPSYQSKTITNLNSDTTINFKGYKVGDSNGDWR